MKTTGQRDNKRTFDELHDDEKRRVLTAKLTEMTDYMFSEQPSWAKNDSADARMLRVVIKNALETYDQQSARRYVLENHGETLEAVASSEARKEMYPPYPLSEILYPKV